MILFRRLTLIVAGFVMVVSLGAQDIHFSQFYLSPLHLNPALTGVMNCNVRAVANYRNQWSSVLKSNAYNTYSVSYDQKIPVGRYDYFGIGGSFWGDQAGSIDYKILSGKLSASYSKRMGGYRSKAHYLVLGAEAGYYQRSVDFAKARWGTQHDGVGHFDPAAPSFEDNFTNDNFGHFDASAGLLWFSVFDDNNNLYFGGAYHHMNRANISFTDTDVDELFSKFTFHAGGEFALSNTIGIVPGVIALFQGPSREINSGASVKFDFTGYNENAFHMGAWFRISNHLEDSITPDALILSTRFDYNEFSFGFSYDINVSSLSPASNNNGAFEFALVYQLCGPQSRGVYCPNF